MATRRKIEEVCVCSQLIYCGRRRGFRVKVKWSSLRLVSSILSRFYRKKCKSQELKRSYLHCRQEKFYRDPRLNPVPPGLFEGGSAWGGGGEVPAACNSKTISDNGMKFGGVIENHKLINLV